MSVELLTRVRMELSLARTLEKPFLPEGYFWVPWDDALLPLHAEVHFRAFADCIDRRLFASFSDRAGCWHLLREIRRTWGFMPEASWLIGHPAGCCATIQCVAEAGGVGSIQNVGVLPKFRGQGLGEALLRQVLLDFRAAGLEKAVLDVTAENEGAYRLYRRLGFIPTHTSQRETLQPWVFA